MGNSSPNTQNRPLSPHLSIYKPQITSVLSITHRLTGVALYAGVFVLAWGIIMGVYSQCNCIFALLTTPVGLVSVAGWSFALFYHLCNGIRHLFWDMGKGFELETVTASGIAVVVVSSVLTAVSWAVALGFVTGGAQ